MLSFDVVEAENRLSELLDKCISGKEIIIVRDERVVAKLVAFTEQKRKHRSGSSIKMIYKDYLKAARKHKITCEVIAEKLNEEKRQKSPDSDKLKSLMLNLYYLSGYVIECMVKYGIYNSISYGDKDDVRDLNKRGLTYDTHIRHHPFERYTEHLLHNMPNKNIRIPLIKDARGIPKETVNVYKEWNAEIRYSYNNFKYKEIHYMEFYKYAKEIFEIIKNNTTKG
ncbi:MAG: hypothetical protein DRI57_06015 [Deltaproteobacteria bacterium]|nr:MAG: hypothetical protein DRI57_06015 [Deltaproteobacteria bacterium]